MPSPADPRIAVPCKAASQCNPDNSPYVYYFIYLFIFISFCRSALIFIYLFLDRFIVWKEARGGCVRSVSQVIIETATHANDAALQVPILSPPLP